MLGLTEHFENALQMANRLDARLVDFKLLRNKFVEIML